MSQFGEFDVPEYGEKPQEEAKKVDKVKAESKPTRTTSTPRRASGGSSGNFFNLMGKLVNPLLVLGGGWYVYNFFIVEGKGLDSEGGILAAAVAVFVLFSAFNFVTSLIGKTIGGVFRFVRSLFGVALLGFIIYNVVMLINQ